jgi:hypothetical protein
MLFTPKMSAIASYGNYSRSPLMNQVMKRIVKDALDLVYGPDGKAMSRKKAERRIQEQNKRRFQRAMAVQS